MIEIIKKIQNNFTFQNTAHVFFLLVQMHLALAPTSSSSSSPPHHSSSYSSSSSRRPSSYSSSSPPTLHRLHQVLLFKILSSLTHKNLFPPANHVQDSMHQSELSKVDRSLFSLVREVSLVLAEKGGMDVCGCCFGRGY